MVETLFKFIKIERSKERLLQLSMYAAEKGYIKIMEWLVEHDGPKNAIICTTAAEHGQLEILKYCRKQGYRSTSEILDEAAKHGHYEIVKWCHKKGYEYDRMIMHIIERGTIEMMQWCHDKGCYIDEDTFLDTATEALRIDMLEWFSGTIRDINTDDALHIIDYIQIDPQRTLDEKEIEILQWCRQWL
jgi:hypothetical protein